MTDQLRPVLRYPGAKARVASWIVDHLPPHEIYIEPFFGAGSVLLSKPAAKVEVANDLDRRVVTFFKVLRDRPLELARAVEMTPFSRDEYALSDEETRDELETARRFLVRCWQSFGVKIGSGSGWDRSGASRGRSAIRLWRDIPDRLLTVADRLAGVYIEARPALDVIAHWSHDDALIYADPPYLRETRPNGDRLYRHELTTEDHIELLEALDRHPGPVVLSGYRCDLYDQRLAHWRREDKPARAYLNARRVESIWINPVAAARVAQPRLELTGVH